MSLLYLLSLVLPVTTLAFLAAPAHHAAFGMVWLASLGVISALDDVLPPIHRGAHGKWLPALAFLVGGVQLVTFGLFVWRVAAWDVTSLETMLAVVMVGVGSAFSSLIAAHELVHRPRGPGRWLGRQLLRTLFYDHFFVDHLRGHHKVAGTPEDVLTARRDETFLAFLARSWPAELARAWRIDRGEVARGFAMELALLLAAGLYGGPAAAALVLLQAAVAHLLSVAVNFIEHWGIVRADTRFRGNHAWDSDAPLSHYALLGLSFHADHHVRASRPFHDLALRDESPKLPFAYFTMIAMVLTGSARVRRILGARLDAAAAGAPRGCREPRHARALG